MTAPIGSVRRSPAGVVAVKRGDWRTSWRASDSYDYDDEDVADWTPLVPAVPVPDHTVRRVARDLFGWNAADLARPRFVLYDVGMNESDTDPYDALVRKVLQLANVPIPPAPDDADQATPRNLSSVVGQSTAAELAALLDEVEALFVGEFGDGPSETHDKLREVYDCARRAATSPVPTSPKDAAEQIAAMLRETGVVDRDDDTMPIFRPLEEREALGNIRHWVPVEAIARHLDDGVRQWFLPSPVQTRVVLAEPREYRCDQPAHAAIPCGRCEPIADGGTDFLGRRYLASLDHRQPRCTGLSSDSLALVGVGAIHDVPTDRYPQDYGDLDACERTYTMAPQTIRDRMLPTIQQYRLYVAEKWPNHEPQPHTAGEGTTEETPC